AEEKRENGDTHHDRQVIAGEPIGDALHIRTMGFGMLHQFDHAPEGGVWANMGGPDAEGAQARERGCEYSGARADVRGHGLAGDCRLVHRSVAPNHLAVHRNLRSWAHDHRLADAHLADRNLLFLTISLDPPRPGAEP